MIFQNSNVYYHNANIHYHNFNIANQRTKILFQNII